MKWSCGVWGDAADDAEETEDENDEADDGVADVGGEAGEPGEPRSAAAYEMDPLLVRRGGTGRGAAGCSDAVGSSTVRRGGEGRLTTG